MKEFDHAAHRLDLFGPMTMARIFDALEEVRAVMAAPSPPAGFSSKKAAAIFQWRHAEQELPEITGAMAEIRSAILAMPDR